MISTPHVTIFSLKTTNFVFPDRLLEPHWGNKRKIPPLPGEQGNMDLLQLDTPGYHPDDKTLKLCDVKSCKEIRTITGHNGYVWDCAFSPDGKTLISVSDDHTLRLWDAGAGTLIKTLELPWIPISVTVSPTTPGLVITANLNGTLTLFEFREIGG